MIIINLRLTLSKGFACQNVRLIGNKTPVQSEFEGDFRAWDTCLHCPHAAYAAVLNMCDRLMFLRTNYYCINLFCVYVCVCGL